MRKHTSIFRVLAVVVAMCWMTLHACEEFSGGESALDVSVRNSVVTSGRGQQFVSVKCAGDWTLSLVADGEEVSWAGLNVTEGRGDKSNVILSYDENEAEQSREMRIVLTSGTKWTDCTFVQQAAGEEVVPEKPVTGGIDLSAVSWMELPAMDDPDLGYFTHSFSMNGKEYRNYSFGWSQKDRIALWVAYPLCDLYLNGSAGRTDAWALDPLLGSLSSAPFGGYGGSYARGHQLPSADRQCNYEANAQTFYGTNMTPQLNGHNSGIWSALEGKVRSLAKSSDTLYVVTGVVVSASSKKEEDSYGCSVTVPDAYFKALLKYSRSSTFGQWNAAAFYLKHETYPESNISKSHSMSIDSLELKTGIDFFVNLPAMVGEKAAAEIEKEDPADNNVWW